MNYMKQLRLIFVARHEIIEPLGMLYLLGLARDLGWEAFPVLVKQFDFTPLYEAVKSFRPDLVCFSIWTGYHVLAFQAAEKVRAMGVPVAIGGPHATFSTEQSADHADWIVKGDGFRAFRLLLQGSLEKGVYFNPKHDEDFPLPNRGLVYRHYPEFGKNPIKSIICSTGCPFQCTYCYAPHRNEMIGGFRLELRSIEDIIREARAVLEKYPVHMFYMQDDVFGFRLDWLQEFARRWKTEVGIPWHCQIRLEMTRDQRRLDLFREGGCTGVTLAIESGNDFLRHHVLFRPMPDELIVEGIRRIQARGLTLRTEQILQVPFSNLETDLQTLELNTRLEPTIAWASILAPYGGTNMGTIAGKFGFYNPDNDALCDTFFDRSVLRHTGDGREVLEPIVRGACRDAKDHPLIRMKTERNEKGVEAYFEDDNLVVLPGMASESPRHCFSFLDEATNSRYCDQVVVLQRLFNWAAKVPQGHKLMEKFLALPKEKWNWRTLGIFTRRHLQCGYGDRIVEWEWRLTEAFSGILPSGVIENPFYFTFLPSGPEFAKRLCVVGFFDVSDPAQQLDVLGQETRHWLYDHALYLVEPASPPIATI